MSEGAGLVETSKHLAFEGGARRLDGCAAAVVGSTDGVVDYLTVPMSSVCAMRPERRYVPGAASDGRGSSLYTEVLRDEGPPLALL